MSKNIFQIWSEIGKRIPFAVRRDNWSNEYYTIVEKIELRRYPYGYAYGYPTINGEYSDHYDYDIDWKNKRVIPCAGCYQWSFVSDANLPNTKNEKATDNKGKNIKKPTELHRKSIIKFGKYRGNPLENVFKENLSYIFWCIRNVASFYISLREIEQLATENKQSLPKDILKILEGKEKFFFD